MCSAARGAVCNAKQKKTVPAKNSEAIFWRPRFTKPLRAGKRANANFACSEGFFLSGVPRHVPGWPFLRRLPLLRLSCAAAACHALCVRSSVLFWLSVCLPCVLCARFSLIFCLFLFGFCRANFFSFVAHAATGIPLLVPSRGFVPGLRVLSPAAFSQTFAPIACFPVLRCSRGFSLLFFSCFLPFPA